MWQMLSLNGSQFEIFKKELERIAQLIHSADKRNNFIVVDSQCRHLMLTPTFHMILSEIIPMLRSLDPVTVDQSAYTNEETWVFLFGDHHCYIQQQNVIPAKPALT